MNGGVKQEYGSRSQNKIVSGVLAKEFDEVFSQEGKEGRECSSKQYNLNAARLCLQKINQRYSYNLIESAICRGGAAKFQAVRWICVRRRRFLLRLRKGCSKAVIANLVARWMYEEM